MAITKGIKQLCAEANAQIRTLSLEEALAMQGDESVQFVDIRDVRELWREGTIPGSYHAPRGMLEFWVDPDSPYYKPRFSDESKTFVLYCGGGMRSALATASLKHMGMENVCHIEGGFAAWKKAGGAIEAVEKKG